MSALVGLSSTSSTIPPSQSPLRTADFSALQTRWLYLPYLCIRSCTTCSAFSSRAIGTASSTYACAGDMCGALASCGYSPAIQLIRGSMASMYRNGPSTPPCGTPLPLVTNSVHPFPVATVYLLERRYFPTTSPYGGGVAWLERAEEAVVLGHVQAMGAGGVRLPEKLLITPCWYR